MSSLDAATVSDLVRRARLVDPDDLTQCLEEMEPGMRAGVDLVRILERKGFLTSWQTGRILKGELDGYFIGGYRLLYRIAAGSFGRVFRADDPATGNVVAVKVLRRKMSEDRHIVDLFYREGKVGLTLQHPNIVRILNVGKDQATNQHFIAMEFVEGGNLRDFLKIRKKLAVLEAVKVIEECASGLAYAFSRGLTHRDLKTTNILMSSQGECKLVDFGLAELHGDAADEDDTDVERTVDYAALERATNVKPGDVRTDIYFLGCVLYELLTGRRPLPTTRDKSSLRSATRYSQLPPIVPNEVQAPRSVFKLLERMTAFQPHDRFPGPAQLHEAVRRVQNELEGHATETISPSGPRTIFVVEGNERVQDALREKLKSLGYRVLMSADPTRAEARYRETPYHSLLVDAGTAGEDGLAAFKRIVKLADDDNLALAAVLLLSETQSEWVKEVKPHAGVGVLLRPISLRTVYQKLNELSQTPVAG